MTLSRIIDSISLHTILSVSVMCVNKPVHSFINYSCSFAMVTISSSLTRKSNGQTNINTSFEKKVFFATVGSTENVIAGNTYM